MITPSPSTFVPFKEKEFEILFLSKISFMSSYRVQLIYSWWSTRRNSVTWVVILQICLRYTDEVLFYIALFYFYWLSLTKQCPKKGNSWSLDLFMFHFAIKCISFGLLLLFRWTYMDDVLFNLVLIHV